MEKSYFEQAVKLIEGNPELEFFSGPRFDEKIDNFEKLLGVQFPESYRRFLKKFGGGGFCGAEFHGIGITGGPYFGVTFLQRKLGDWPHCVYSVGEGTQIAIDTSRQNEQGECPIVDIPIYYEVGDKLEIVARGFDEFFYTTIKNVVTRYRND